MEKCYRCNGTGKYMGNGMMMTDCTLCDEDNVIKKPSLDDVDRTSKSYKKAIKEIMQINDNISKEEAIKMFDDAYLKG